MVGIVFFFVIVASAAAVGSEHGVFDQPNQTSFVETQVAKHDTRR